MIEYLRELGLDIEVLRRHRDVSLGFADAYKESLPESTDREMTMYAAATNYRQTAADSLLLDEMDRAQDLFQASASAYLTAGTNYGVLLANLGNSMQSPSYSPQDLPRASDVFWLWQPPTVAHSRIGGEQRWQRLRDEAEGFRTERVGILGLTIGAYLELFDAVSSSSDNNVSAIGEALLPFIVAYSTAFKRAAQDRYHWSRMAVPFHPVEPETLAVLVAVERRMPRLDFIESLLGSLPLDRVALLVLRGALRKYDRRRQPRPG